LAIWAFMAGCKPRSWQYGQITATLDMCWIIRLRSSSPTFPVVFFGRAIPVP
jgi:hypothetical protein